MEVMRPPGRRSSLVAIKILHTVIWGVLASCVLAMPVAAIRRNWNWVAGLNAAVLAECLILAANRGLCPLTGWAARYTEDRRANFDIYLPAWLARNNKAIFGTLFLCGEGIVLWRWLS